MGAFSKFKKAVAAKGPVRRFELGSYRCRIDSVKFMESRKKVEFFAVGFTIVEVLTEDSKMQVGDTADWSAMSDWDNYDSLVKEFICKAYDSSEDDINEMTDEEFDELMTGITKDEQKARGRLLDVECIDYVNKEKEDTTVTRFKPVPDEEYPAEAAAA